ncbi:MAG: hypothetical protein ACRDIY_22280 [Chloroflexota bacterium]
MLWRVIRRLLAVGIRALIWRPVVSFTVVAVALGIVGFFIGGPQGAQLIQGSVTPGATSPSTASAIAIPITSVQAAPATTPPAAVDEYIKGMTSFDAQMMWDALDPQAVQAMQSQGGSEQQLQQRLNDAKQKGASYEGVVFVGGYPLQNGDRFLFYVVSRRGFASPGVADQVFFVFTVGPNGKIIRIE